MSFIFSSPNEGQRQNIEIDVYSTIQNAGNDDQLEPVYSRIGDSGYEEPVQNTYITLCPD